MNEGSGDASTRKLIYGGIVLLSAVLTSSCYVPSSRILYSEAIGTLEQHPRKAFVVAYMGAELPEPFQNGYIEAIESELGKRWRLLQTFDFSYEPLLKRMAFDGGAKIAHEAFQAAWSSGVFARPTQTAPTDTTRM